jgi:hypothetical protein
VPTAGAPTVVGLIVAERFFGVLSAFVSRFDLLRK